MESHLPRTPVSPLAARGVDGLDDGGAGAVEIAAMLGDSVVGVKHCVDPRSGKISSLTYGFAAAGIACLLASAIAFVVSVRAAAHNAGKLAYWTQVEHKPARAFRPDDVGVGVDIAAFAGLALALVGLTTALVRARAEKRSPYYRIGTDAGVEQPALGAPSPSFPLVAPSADGDDFVFNYGAGIDGEMIVDGHSTPLAALAAAGRAHPSPTTIGAIEVPIPARARIRARVGQTTFLVSATGKPRRQATPLFTFENRAAAYFGASLAAHLAIWAVLQAVPVEGTVANLELDTIEQTGVRLTGAVTDDVPPPPEESKAADASPSGGTGTAMALADGAMGDPKSARASGRYAIEKRSDQPALARLEAIEAARSAGILGSDLLREGDMASVTGTANLASGFSDATIYGGLIGDEVGAAKGGFGYGRWGFGPGGGGIGWGTVGTGRFGTIGQGSGAGDGYGVGNGHGPLGPKHQATVPPVTIGRAILVGDLDRSIIRRYIMRNVEKITYCYDKQLLAKPGIEGSIKIAFFIAPDGSVTTSTGDGFDGEVASCVAGVIKSIAFPRPDHGGGVQVNYPFTFHSTK